MAEQVELHLFRPGEREYVRLAKIIRMTKSSMILIARQEPHFEVGIEACDPNARLDSPDMPPKVFVYEQDELYGLGYFRRFGNIIDIVLVD